MIVNPTPLDAAAIAPVTPVTRISLADLLLGAGGNAATEQALVELLRSHGTASARVLETRADGASVLDFGHARIVLRLAGTPAPGTLLLVSIDAAARDAAHDATFDAAPRASGGAEVKLSSAAQLIHDFKKLLLNQIVINTEAAEAMPPLVPAEATPQALAQALQQAVRSSGLFYESHLREWADGRMPLNEIRDEPQARVAQALPARGGETREAVHPELEHLVRQQLDTLERQAIAWRSSVWPDQQAQIVIARDAASTTDAPQTWHIHLEMETPTLGAVKADVALTDRQLVLRMRGEAAALPALRAARDGLAQALCAHGLSVSPIQFGGGD